MAVPMVMERLEPRVLLATYTVTSVADSGPGSLRDAIQQANSHPGADAIDFAAGLSGTITLGGTQLEISDDLTIAGPGASALTVSGNHASRVFLVDANVTATVDGITVTGGNFAGDGAGGGIENEGSLTLSNAIITGNHAQESHSGTGPVVGDGGGIFNSGTLALTNCSISDNSVSGGVPGDDENGGAIFNSGGLTVIDSIVSDNSVPEGGGGIVNSGSLYLRQSTVAGNSATQDSGNPIGGGILTSGSLTVSESTIEGNNAGAGGGIFNSNGVATLINSNVSGNSAGYAGGIFNFEDQAQASMSLTNCTVSGNSASGGGGGIYNFYGLLTLTNSTISANDASTSTYGGGIWNYSGAMTLDNTIVAGNLGGSPKAPNDLSGSAATTNSAENLIGTGGSAGLVNGVNGNLVGVADPKLGPLADNGGPTQTMALLPGSPAIDAGDNSLALDTSTTPPTPLATDQRGDARVANGRVDIGAFELTAVGTHSTELVVVDASAAYGGQSTLSATLTTSALTPAPLAGEVIGFVVNGYNAGSAITDANGTATFNGVLPSSISAGAHAGGIVALFGGDSNYAAISGSANLTVARADTEISVGSPFGQPGDPHPVALTAKVTAKSPSTALVNEGTVNFTVVDGQSNTVAAVNNVPVKGGRASALLSLTSLKPGTYSIRASYTDSSVPANFNPSTVAKPGTITPLIVTNLHDSGPGSLRDAIQQANSNPGRDAINFAAGLSGTILLAGTELEISDDLSINRPDTGLLTVSAGNSSQGFQIDPNVAAEIDGITISDGVAGNSPGAGGIDNSGMLTLNGDVILDNRGGGIYNDPGASLGINNSSVSGNLGGGIVNDGILTLSNCDVTDNHSIEGFSRGGILNDGTLVIDNSRITGNTNFGIDTLDPGGGICNFRTLTITDSTVEGNSARLGGGVFNGGNMTITDSNVDGNSGGGIANRGVMTVTNSIIQRNAGGGVYNSGSLTMVGSTVYGNAGAGIYNAAAPAGGQPSTLAISHCEIDGNTSSGDGGGISNSGTLTLDNSSMGGNFAADDGGGIANFASLTVVDCTLLYNRATVGGGIANESGGIANEPPATLTINSSTLANNSGGVGGGIYNEDTSAVTNDTITGNSAAGHAFDNGGGIANYGALLISDSTITANDGEAGGGVSAERGTTVLRNTIVAGNFGSDASTSDDISGSLATSQSRSNLIGTGGSGGLTNGVNGNLVGIADPKLAPLGDYGGPTFTMPPLAGSPAIDAGSNALAVDANGNPLTTDQRGPGFVRLSGAAVDIGAVELTQFAGSQLYLRKDSDGLNLDVWQDSPTPGVGAPTVKLPLSEVPGLLFSGTAGNDTLTFDSSNGGPPGTTLSYDGGAGNNTLRIIGTSGNDTIEAGTGDVTAYVNNIFSVTIFVANLQTVRFPGGSGGNDTLYIEGGTYTVDASTPATAGQPNVSVEVGSGVVTKLTGDQRLAGLTVNGLLDVGSNKLWTTTPAATIRGYLKSGYGPNQDWTGTTGITSSLAVGNPTKYTIGYADGNDPSAQDAGIAVSPGQVLVQPTLVGDANLDGTVNFLDLPQLLGYKFNTHQPASYTDGDLNYDGVVDFLDLAALFSANYNTGQSFAAAAAAANTAPAETPVAAPLSAEAAASAMPPVPGSAVQGTPFSQMVIPEINGQTLGGTPVLPDWPAAKKRSQIFADGGGP
jgi:hypothetical protein